MKVYRDYNCMSFLKRHENIVIGIISIIVSMGFLIDPNPELAINESFPRSSIIPYIIAFLMYNIFYHIKKIDNKRMKTISIMIAIVLALFEIIGTSLNSFMSLSGIIESKSTLIKTFLRLLSYCCIFYAIVLSIFQFIEKKSFNEKIANWFTCNIKSFLWIWFFIFLAWIPYLLKYNPGMISQDSMNQICQSLGIYPLRNHHPVFHTLFIGIFMNIGKLLNNYNVGIFLYSLAQMLIMSAIFSYSIYFMAKIKVNKVFRIIVLLYYAFYPVHALYSMTMWKDILFAGFMLLFVIILSKMYTDKKKFFEKKRNILLLLINMILLFLFRNNGFHVVLLTIPFIIMFSFKYYKKILIVVSVIILINLIWKGPIFKYFNITKGSIGEALSIPIQQFARVEKYKDLTEEEKNKIHKYISVGNAGEIYNPILSDPVKNCFNLQEYNNDKIGFYKLYFEFLFKYPGTTIEAFLCQNYGYWYPGISYWIVEKDLYSPTIGVEGELHLQRNPLLDVKIIDKINNIMENKTLPFIPMFFSIGFAFWIFLIMFGYVIYKKDYNKIIVYLPILFLWLTTIASPVFGEYRYIYSLFTCLPVLIGINLKNQEKSSE